MKTILKLALIILCFPMFAEAQTATIDWGTPHQQMQGFGAYNGYVGTAMNPYDTLFFNTLGYSLLRTTVPLGPGGAGPYPCDSIQSSCSTGGDSITDMTSCVANNCSVWGVVGNPPAEYNSSGTFACSVNPALKPASYAPFASYISNFIASLRNFQNIPLIAMSVQNEPDNSGGGCQMSAAQMATFIKTNLGPTMASAGQSSTLIMMPEVEAFSDYTAWGDTCMNDGSCSSYVGINAFHDYGNASSVSNSYGKLFWQTEVSDIGSPSPVAPGCAGNVWCPTISDALMWATIISNYINEGVGAWHYFWYVDNDTTYGTNANVALINPAQGTPIAKRTYAIANWAKFVRPGYVNINATANPQAGVYVSSFQDVPSKTLVIVAVNTTGAGVSQTFSLSNAPSFTSVTPWITSASQNLVQLSSATVTANSFTYTLPASSVVTFVGNSPAGTPTGFYLAQNSTGTANGSNCLNALSYTYFNNSANWGSGAGQIGPDSTVHLCGNFTGGAGSTFLTFHGSGTSGHPITLVCESPGVTISAPYWAGNPSGAIAMGANSFITLNGSNCTLTSTANGTNLANQTSDYGITGSGSTQIVENWNITNFYVRVAGGHELSDNSIVRAISLDGSNDIVDGNTITYNGWAINLSSTSDNAIVRNNSIQYSGHGVTVGGAHWYVYGNHVYDFGVWDSDNDAYHQDGIHCFAGNSGNTIVGYAYNNRMDGSWGNNMNQPIFLEQGDSSTKCFVDNGHVVMFNNVLVGDGHGVNFGLNSYGGTSITPNGDLIVNNLAIGGNPGGNSPEGLTIVQVPSAHCPACSATFENNAMTDTGLGEVSLVAGEGVDTMDYDAFEACSGGAFSCYAITAGPNYSTIAAWHTATGFEAHGIANEAASLNAYFKLNNSCVPGSVSANCSPQGSSPLIGVGANLFSVCNGQASPGLGDLCKDINGVSRPNAAWTIGPYQVSGSTPTASTPSCSPGAGTYSSTQSVSCSVGGGAPVMCWAIGAVPATNGSSGCATGGSLYTGAIAISSSGTLEIIAGGTGFLDGAVQTYAYVISTIAGPVVCSPGAGTYSSTQSVTCTASPSTVKCYTVNGVNPQTNGGSGCLSGILYSGAISVSASETIKIVGGGTSYTDGPIASYAYVITPQTANPASCNPGTGTYTSSQPVSCLFSSPGSIGCYTLNGTTPATNGSTGCTTGTKYLSAISITTSESLKVISGGTGYTDSSVVTYIYTISPPPQASTPSCSPGTGSYVGTVSVSCTFSSPGSIGCFTTNGTTPQTNSASGCTVGSKYVGSVSLFSTTTFKAISGGTGYTDSSVVSNVYTITGPPSASTPVCSPGSGIYTGTQSVSCSAGSSTVQCYTTDGSTPATNGTTACTTGTKYTVAISIASTSTLKVIAGGTGFTDGSVATYSYTISPPFASTPVCSPVGGTYPQPQSVTCSAATGPVICYTVNGATPQTNGTSGCTTGTLYSGAITVSSTETLKAVAGGTSYSDGSVASYSYTITQPNNGGPCPSCLAGPVTDTKAEAL